MGAFPYLSLLVHWRRGRGARPNGCNTLSCGSVSFLHIGMYLLFWYILLGHGNYLQIAHFLKSADTGEKHINKHWYRPRLLAKTLFSIIDTTRTLSNYGIFSRHSNFPTPQILTKEDLKLNPDIELIQLSNRILLPFFTGQTEPQPKMPAVVVVVVLLLRSCAARDR